MNLVVTCVNYTAYKYTVVHSVVKARLPASPFIPQQIMSQTCTQYTILPSSIPLVKIIHCSHIQTEQKNLSGQIRARAANAQFS